MAIWRIPSARAVQARSRRRPAGIFRIVPLLLQLALVLAAERDIGRHADAQIRGQKRWWRLAALLSPVGPAAYFVFGRRRAPAGAA